MYPGENDVQIKTRGAEGVRDTKRINAKGRKNHRMNRVVLTAGDKRRERQ